MSHHEFITRIQRQLEEWDYQLDRFEHRVGDLGQQLQERARGALKALRQRRNELAERLDQAGDASEDALEDLRDGLEIALDGLKTGYYAARAEFEDETRKD